MSFKPPKFFIFGCSPILAKQKSKLVNATYHVTASVGASNGKEGSTSYGSTRRIRKFLPNALNQLQSVDPFKGAFSETSAVNSS